ncbi:glyoxylate reductase/hydroxypyruvate reductase-like [Culicoides brevitarsis]|uniref:glyoxylate reductase/hydroxypyruvate reductase-like n=1 Tax=Culicoides brevitarsis TaxID=469753 RepID=UPI00307B6D8E
MFRPLTVKFLSTFTNKLINRGLTKSSINMARPNIYLTRPDIAPEAIEMLKSECDVTIWNKPSPVPRDELLANIKDKEALYCTLCDKIDSVLLDAGSKLKVISTISVGYDHIDVAECKKRGIRIGYTPDVLTDATAELTMALLLSTARRLFQVNKEVFKPNGIWATEGEENCGQGIRNSVVGIVGFGRIGHEVARRLIPFKPREILYFNRSEKAEWAREVAAKKVSFDELLEKSDFVVSTIALNEETKNLFNAETFSKMKSSAVFVNTGRGGVVDEEALYETLKNNRIYAAGLDVTQVEPLPLNSKLLTLENCNILPHIGSAEVETRAEMAKIAAENLLKGLKGEKMVAEL